MIPAASAGTYGHLHPSVLMRDFGRAFVAPVALMRDVRGDHATRSVLAFVLVVSLMFVAIARVVGAAIAVSKTAPGYLLNLHDFALGSLLFAAFVPPLALAITASLAGILHLLAHAARGCASYPVTLALCAYASVPFGAVSVVFVAVSLVSPSLNQAAYSAWLLGWLWSVGVVAAGLRECHQLPTKRVCAVVALPTVLVAIALAASLFGGR